MAEIKQIGEHIVIIDYSLNIPVGHVFVNGIWTDGAVVDLSKSVQINEFKIQKQKEYNDAHPIIQEETSAVS